MEQIYLFEDWTSAIRMKNQLNPCLTIDIEVIRSEDKNDIDGYNLIVRDCSLLRVNNILYRFYIDYGKPGTWSLSTDEAIRFLNQIGFPCKFNKENYNISNEVRKTLSNVMELGFTHISRRIRPPEVEVLSAISASIVPLSVLVGEYNYHDYWFIESTPEKIAGILSE